MNFDFLSGVSGLGEIKPHCENAEELAITQPDSSMFKSRKSAEGIARFVYLHVYTQRSTDLSFADILNDTEVKNFLANRRIMDAFHRVRRQGNTAVHNTNATLTQDAAIDVLRDLHFVAGEVAKKLKLISDYPPFNSNLSAHPEANYLRMDDDIAVSMYNEYLRSKDTSEEYYNRFVDMCCRGDIFIPGRVEFDEVLEIKHTPNERVLQLVREHFGLLCFLKQKQISDGVGKYESEISLEIKLTVYGKNAYTTTDILTVMNGLFCDIEESEGFKICSYYLGSSFEPWDNNDSRISTIQYINSVICADKGISYTYFEFYFNGGEGTINRWIDGNWVNYRSSFSSEILDKSRDKWFCWYADLGVDFDFEKYPDILISLRNAVQRHLPKEEYENTAPFWEDGELGHLVVGAQWTPKRLRDIQNFLDDINAIIAPIKSECDCGADGTWYCPEDPFAVATWEWTKDGFVIIGTEV